MYEILVAFICEMYSLIKQNLKVWSSQAIAKKMYKITDISVLWWKYVVALYKVEDSHIQGVIYINIMIFNHF